MLNQRGFWGRAGPGTPFGLMGVVETGGRWWWGWTFSSLTWHGGGAGEGIPWL